MTACNWLRRLEAFFLKELEWWAWDSEFPGPARFSSPETWGETSTSLRGFIFGQLTESLEGKASIEYLFYTRQTPTAPWKEVEVPTLPGRW